MATDHLADILDELGVRQLDTRHVDGHGETAWPAVAGRPLGKMAARLVQDERVDPADEPVLLGEGDEIVWSHDSPLGMTPAHQRLDADQRLVLQGEEWLVEEEQFLVLDSVAQLGLEEARPGGDALGGVEDPITVPPCFLGLVHRPVGVADQLLGLGQGIAGDDDPDAAGDGEVAPILEVGDADPPDDAIGDETDVVVVIAQSPAQHDELVATESGNGVGIARQEREPATDLGEHLVAGIVTERVVDRFEVVQVDIQDRKPRWLPFQGSKSLRQPVHQGGPVHQTGHRVVQDLVGQGVLCRDLRRDISRNAERPDNPAVLITKRHLRGRDPVVRAVVEGLPLQLPHDRLAGGDDLLLVRKSRNGVFLAEQVEVSLPDHLFRGTVRNDPGEEACANQEEPALQVLEVRALLCGGQQVVHAGELEIAQLFALLRPL